jgi:hypothetical protein
MPVCANEARLLAGQSRSPTVPAPSGSSRPVVGIRERRESGIAPGE